MAKLKLTSKLTFNETTYELYNYGPYKYHLFIDGNPTTWHIDFDNKAGFNFYKLISGTGLEYPITSPNDKITLTLFNNIITQINKIRDYKEFNESMLKKLNHLNK